MARNTVYLWLHRFEAHGLAGLEDAPREGRSRTYTPYASDVTPFILSIADLAYIGAHALYVRYGPP